MAQKEAEMYIKSEISIIIVIKFSTYQVMHTTSYSATGYYSYTV